MAKNKSKNKKKLPNNKIWKTIGGNIIIWILIIIMSVTALQIFSSDNNPKEITFSDLTNYLNSGKVESAEIVGRTFNGKFTEPEIFENEVTAESKEYSNFVTILPEVSIEMTRIWDENNLKYEFKDQSFGLTEYLLSLIHI